MSMQNIEHQGYGVDLGDFHSAITNYQEVIENLITNDDIQDYINTNSLDCCVDTPVNYDGFIYLVYIPAIIPVVNNSHKIKTYTEKEAKEAIFKTIKDAITNNHLANDLANKNLADDFFSDLRKFVNKDADYSYNHDWSDLV